MTYVSRDLYDFGSGGPDTCANNGSKGPLNQYMFLGSLARAPAPGARVPAQGGQPALCQQWLKRAMRKVSVFRFLGPGLRYDGSPSMTRLAEVGPRYCVSVLLLMFLHVRLVFAGAVWAAVEILV